MKIGVDARVLMDEYYSGVSQYTANLLMAILLIDQENQYKLFYNSWHNFDERLKIWQRKNTLIKGFHIPNKIFNYLGQKLFSYPKIDFLMGGVDIFWSPHFNFTTLNRKVKKIITVHDLSFLRYPEFFNARQNFWHRALNIKKSILAADKIIAVSENTKNDILELIGPDPEKVSVIYSGNNAIKRAVSENEAQAFFKKNNLSGRLILYIGTIEPRKNIAGLIRAFNSLKENNPDSDDLKLVLAGANGWRNKKIYTEWDRSPYKKDIIFLGYISQIEKEILYAKSFIFVYPSFYEGFGFPPLEAMTYGLPVICSNVSSLSEVVGDAALMINPFVPQEISEALSLLINSPVLRESLVNKGLIRAQVFSWEKTARAYLEIFKNLAC